MSLRHRRPWALLPDSKLNSALAGLVVAGVLFNGYYLLRSVGFALQPRALTYTEGVNAILATRPDLWFQPVAQAPHFPTIYPLGYHALVNLLWRGTGASPFVIMHLIGLSAALGGAWAVAMLVRRRSATWTAPAVAAALYALSPAVSGATVLGRVDHLGVALGLFALVFAARERFWAAVALTVAAMYVKHSLVVFPIAIFGWLILFEDERQALKYGAAVAGAGLGILAVLSILTDGQAWLHLVEYNRDHPWLFSVFSGQLVWFAYTHIAIAGMLVYCLLAGRVQPLVGVFAIAAIITSLITIGKVGSWVGYFLPVIAAGAWLTGDLAGQFKLRSYLKAALIAVVIAQFALYGAWAGQMTPKYEENAQARVIAEIETVGGPILAEDGTLYVKTGVGQVHEPLMMRFVYEYDSYEGDNLANEIRERQFTRIIIGQSIEDWEPGDTSRWHDEELKAMKEHYVRVWAEDFYYVYAPKNGLTV